MARRTKEPQSSSRARPLTHQAAREFQAYNEVVPMPIALSQNAARKSIENLNQLLADTATLRDLYKKHHWQVAGSTFYQLHLLFDKHYEEQNDLVDALAERIQMLGGVFARHGARHRGDDDDPSAPEGPRGGPGPDFAAAACA